MGRKSGGRGLTRTRTSAAVVALAVALTLGARAAAAPAVPATPATPAEGSLTVLTGPGGCLGVGAGCGHLRGVQGIVTPVNSPDGRNLYLIGDERGIAVLRRDPGTGRLAQLAGRAGCLVAHPLAGCTTVPALRGLGVGAVTPDGGEFDVTTASGVLSFTRAAAGGALTPIAGPRGCVDATHRTACAPLTGLTHPTDLVAAGNGTLYVAGNLGWLTGALVTLRRDPATGALTQQPGCLNGTGSRGCRAAPCLQSQTSLAPSPDGSFLYAGSTSSLDNELTGAGTVLSFRTAPTGLTTLGCAHRREATSDLVAVPGSREVVASTLSGNRGTGIEYATLDLYRSGASGTLARGRRLGCTGNRRCGLALGPNVSQLAATPDGRTVYVSYYDSGVEALRLDAGRLTPLPAASGCLAGRDAYQPPRRCQRAHRQVSDGLLVSRDGRNLYVSTFGSSAGGQTTTSGIQALRIRAPR